MASPFQNPTSSTLNAHALPYVKLPPHLPLHYHLPPTFMLSYSPHYVYQVYSAEPRVLPPKSSPTFFPRVDVVEKDCVAEKRERNISPFNGPRVRSRRSCLLKRKVEKEKSCVGKKGYRKKEINGHVEFSHGSDITSLMIRNIPNKFQRQDLLKILDQHCLEENKIAKLHCEESKSKYDFLYLPIDFKTGGNLGYAFVNFTTPSAASRFRDAFQHHVWEVPNRRKICEVANAAIQGRDALRNHFRNSVFPCHTNDYLPVIFSPPRHGSNCPRFDIVGRRVDASTPLTK